MARARTAKQNDIVARFSGLTQDALQKLTEVPGGTRVVDMLNESKARLDDMQKKLRGLDALEKRVAKLEKQVSALSAQKAATGANPVSARTTAKPATPKKPPA